MLSDKLREKIKNELDEWPVGYDAHNDGLSDDWSTRESLNKLLALLRAIARELKL